MSGSGGSEVDTVSNDKGVMVGGVGTVKSSNAKRGSIGVLWDRGGAAVRGVTKSAARGVSTVTEEVSGVLEGEVLKGLEGEDCDRSCHKGILEVFAACEVRTDDGFTLPGVVELVVETGSLSVGGAGPAGDSVAGWRVLVV